MTDTKFMTPPHRRAYLTHLNRCKAMDSYHRALIYTLTAVPAPATTLKVASTLKKMKSRNHWPPVGRPAAQLTVLPITLNGYLTNPAHPMTCSTVPLRRICTRP